MKKAIYALEINEKDLQADAIELMAGAGVPREDLLAIVRDLEKEMRRLSKELQFEDAARVRDRIIALRKRLSGEDGAKRTTGRGAGDRGGAEAEDDGPQLAERRGAARSAEERCKRAAAASARRGQHGWMETLGRADHRGGAGRVVLELEAGPQHRHGGGVVQGGVITQIADAAMGMSLATLQEDGMWNTTIELKINFIRPVVAGPAPRRRPGRRDASRRCSSARRTSSTSEGRLVARASSTCLPVPEGQGRE